MGKISISAPDKDIEKWKQYAEKYDISMSQFVKRALKLYCMCIERKRY